MRVLHVGKFFSPFAGGIENFMLDLTRACARQDVRQACLVHESPGATGQHEPTFQWLEWVRRVPVRTRLSYAPISPGFRHALRRAIDDFRPDLLHLHMPNPSAFWTLAEPRARAMPWLVHWHSDVVGPGLDFKLRLFYPAYRPFEQAVLRRASAVIVTSPPYLDSSLALHRWREKCRVIPLGLDPARLRTDPDHEWSGGDWRGCGGLRVFAVGRLSRYKGFDNLIRSASRVKKVEVLIAGDGDERRRLERLVARNVAGRVRLLGVIDDRHRNQLLSECDLVCMSSINRAEAFGLTLVEAMAAGKPQIATRVPGSGMDWVIEEGRTGWMVAPGDTENLAATFKRLLRDRSVLAAYGQRAREQFERRFHIDTVADRTLELYYELVG